MQDKISSNLRKWISLITAVFLYYLIHEGSHLIVALSYGAFQEVKFLGLGIQIAVDDTVLSEMQLAVFCVVGSIAALMAGYILVAFTNKIVRVNSKYFKAIGFYTTLILLLLDPVYLSVLYRLFGGGDMNGILLFGLPEIFVQLIYGATGVINLIIFMKFILPKYREAFARS